MEISTKLKQRFCKDCNIPIKTYQEPYFTDRLELYDKFYGTLDKWETFTEELEQYENEQDYFADYNRIKEGAIDFIKSSKGYQNFCNEDMNRYSITNTGLPSKDIYKTSNDGKAFISIDMRQANFSALKNYSEDVFEGSSWEGFISRFTTKELSEHIINSKYIRQVILGNCNPKRQVAYEKCLMDTMLNHIRSEKLNNVVFFSNDEIIFDVTELLDKDKVFTYLKLKATLQHLTIDCRCELFTFNKLNGTDGYVKTIYGKLKYRHEFKCLNSYMLPFAVRYLNNEEVSESDKVFYHEGLLSKFIEVPKISMGCKRKMAR